MPPVIDQLILRYGRARVVMTAGVAIVGAVLLWGVANWATAPAWVPLLPTLPLESVGPVTDRLGEAGIAHRLARGGTLIEVAEKDLARARVVLAQAGLPARGRPGFELFDQPAWGMTDFTQRINYRRALEGELERSIAQMRGIEGAQVHLALRETSSLRRSERPIEASVLLRLTPGISLPGEQVDAIAFLVASSVEGLSTDNISVLDDQGRVLSAAVQPGSTGHATKRHVALQRETESYLERRAEDLLVDVLGQGNARVRVSAALNFDRLDRTSLQFDPETQVITREERSEIVPGTPEQGASSLVESSTFEVSRTSETLTTEPGGVRRLTVAVMVNERALTGAAAEQAALLARIEALVRNAVGVEDSRGDAISVVGVPFEPRSVAPPEAAPPVVLWERVGDWVRPGIGALALMLGFIIVLQALRAIRPAPAPAPVLASAGAAPLPPQEPAHKLPQETPAAVREREELAALLAERPENATRVIRAWLKDA